MLFTIYIPMYNGEKYIERAIKSVLNQSFDDYELLVINDGSTDKSASIVNEYAKGNPRIRMFSQDNKGLFHARISAFKYACGEYILALDADDEIEPDLLEKLHVIIEHNTDVDLIEYSLKRTDFISKGIVLHKKDSIYNVQTINDLFDQVLWTDTYNSQCTKAIKTDIVRGIDEIETLDRISMGEDRIHTLNYLWRLKNVVVIDEPLYLYRYTLDSMSNFFNERVFDDILQINKACLRFNSHVNGIYKISDINKMTTIAVSKAILYTPSMIKGKDGKKKYYLALKKLKNNNSLMGIINDCSRLRLIYSLPLALLKSENFTCLYILKKITSYIRRTYDRFMLFYGAR